MSTNPSRQASVAHVEICDRLRVRPGSGSDREGVSSSPRPSTPEQRSHGSSRSIEVRDASPVQAVEITGRPFGPVGLGGHATYDPVIDPAVVWTP